MARLLVNKHFTEHNEAINGFTNVEDYAFGEIIICNDSEKPSIYIKDIDNNSVAISNIKVSETDDILSLKDNKLSAKISMVWDSENDKIKLLGKAKDDTNVVLSEIEIFNDEENGIGNKIDKAVERAVDVTLFTATDTELPEGTEVGQDYLKIETSSNGVVKQSYIPFLTVDKLFTVEGEDNTDKSGKIIVTKDEGNNKYVISHGEVNRVGEKLENPAFGLTPFISEIGVNDLGHVTSVKTSVLPSTPGISITTAPEELPEDDTNLYVSKVTKTDKMGLTVTYSELPKVEIDATVKDSANKTLKFISNIEASGSTITGVTSEVNLDGYAKTGDYYEKSEIDEKFKKIIDPDGELIVPPVVITGDTTEVGKYIYDIDVNSEGALEIKTQALGLDSYVKNELVSASDTTLEWGANKEIIKIDEKITTVTLPIKPGIKISEEEDTSSNKVIVGVESVEENTDSEVLSMKFKTKEFDFENALAKKDIEVPTTTPTLDWEQAVTIATIGGTKIDVAMPSPVNVEVTGEDVNEINSVVTAIEGDEHGIKVKSAPFAAKNYVAKDEVNTSNVELPWGTKDAEGNFNTTTIATIGEKTIEVALPEKPVVGMVTGNTSIENPVVVTNIELNENNELVVNFQDALPKNYITSGDLKTYLDVDSIKVVDGTADSTENKFITSIVTGTTEDNDVQLTVNYGKYDIDGDTTISSETVQLEWDTPSEIAKIGNKTISVKLPEKDNVDAIVAEKIVTYDLDKTQEGDKITISLTPTINDEKGEADTIDIDLSSYVNENVDITVDDNQLPENYTGNTFIKNISINGTEITREFGEVNVDVSSNNETVLEWNKAVEIAKVDGKSIYAKLPLEPEKGQGADGNTLYKLSGTLTDDEFKVSLMSGTDGVNYETAAGSATLDLSGYLTSGDVETYIPVKDVQVDNVSVLDKDGIAKITGTTVVSNDITLEWGKSNTIAKVNDTEIKFTMPAEPEKGQDADGNTKYTISGSLANDGYKITLNNLDDEKESTSVTLDLSDYLTSGDVGTYIPVKGVKVNDESVVDVNGIANIKIEDTAVTANNPTLGFGETTTIAKINNTEIQVTMPAAPAQVETKVDDIQINGTTIVNDKIANIEVVDNLNTLAWNTSVEIAKVGGVAITAKLPVKPDGENGVTDTTYTLSGAADSNSFKVTLTGSDNSTGIATLNFSDIPFNETSITTGKTNTGNFVKNITFNGNKNHNVNVEYGDPDLSEYSKTGHTHSEYAPVSHSHNASAITGGTLDIARIPTGTDANTVALGNHGHDAYAKTVHTHDEYANQNAFGKVTDGTTTVTADSTIDTLTIAGSGNITVNANASTDTITIGINDGSYSKTGHTHDEYALVSHSHNASAITGGTLDIARIPTGTDANSVALGNHGHDAYAKTSHTHSEYVNQNAFGKVTDGSTTFEADSATDTLTIAGSGNITVSANTSTDTITIGINDGNYSKTGHTHSEYAPVNHSHNASAITGGTLDIARIPTGTDVNSVALGNHGHDGVYLKTGDFHDTNATLDGHYDPLASLTATTLSAENGKYISAVSFDEKKHITDITTTPLPTSAEEAKKLSVGTVGSTTTPVYFKDGAPAVCTLNYLKDTDVTTTYLTNKIGNYYLTAETYKGTVTDTKTVVSNTNTGKANAATTNGATYLNTVLTNQGNTSVVSSHNIKGSGSVTVSSDANGVITISGVEYQPIGNYLTKETYLGTISGITVGSGLTGGGSAAAGATGITIKPNLSSYSSLGTIGTTSKLYAVGVDSNNKLCVNVPWADEKYNGTVTSVGLKTGSTFVALTGSTITSSGTYTFDLSEATKLKIDNGSTAYGWGDHADKGYWIPTAATTTVTGIVKLVSGDMNGKAYADGQAPSLNHTHSQYLTSTDLTNKGYATEQWVKDQEYLTDEYQLPIATAKVLGGIKLGYTESGKNYAVKTLTDGTAYVTVPWTDTNTDTATTQDGHYSPETVTETVSVGNQTPSHGGTFNIPTISFDSKGHYVSTGTTTVTLPTDNNTDEKVTSVENHYAPSSSTTISASGGNEVDITGTTTQVITGLDVDAAGHVVSVRSKGLKATNTITEDTHYTSKNIVSTASTATADTVAIPNGRVYLNHIENGAVTSSHSLTGINGIIITRPTTAATITVGINSISEGTGITNTSTSYTQGKAVYEYVNTAVPDIVDTKLSGFTGSDEMVKSEVIGDTTKAYLLASSASTEETGTALKSSSIFMSGNTLTAEAFYQNSDERLKDFHNEIEVDFDKLRALPKSYFTWKSDDTKTMQLGTSAQKVKELYPELVGGTEESLSVDYARLSIVALKAVDKLHEENEKLRAELDAIKKHLGL